MTVLMELTPGRSLWEARMSEPPQIGSELVFEDKEEGSVLRYRVLGVQYHFLGSTERINESCYTTVAIEEIL